MRWPLMVLLVLVGLLPNLIVSGKAKVADQQLLNSVEESFIKIFGLNKRPRPNRRDIVIPQELLDLYTKQTGMDVDTTNFKLPGRLTASANTVRTFTHQVSPIDTQFRRSHRFRLFFKTDIPKAEKLKAAELHLSREAMESLTGQEVTVLVQEIISPGIKNKREPILRLVDSKKIFVHENDTVRLDVTPAVARWLEEPNKNYGLLVIVTMPKKISVKKRNYKSNKDFFNSLVLKNSISERMEKHVRLKRDVKMEIAEWKKAEPVLFLFTDDNKFQNPEKLLNRAKRANRKNRRKDGRDHCRRHELYVDFIDVGWNDWIVAPPGYDAYYCSGDCPFPLSDHFNSTNHAIVQTLVNSVFPNTAPKACCVPTQLAPISMLYVDEENKVVLKNYQDMSIVGCGCR